jgi:HEAT repeat protein
MKFTIRPISSLCFASAIVACLVATTFASEKYKFTILEVKPVKEGLVSYQFVEKEADLAGILKALESKDEFDKLAVIRAIQFSDRWHEGDRKALIEAMGKKLTDEFPSIRYRAAETLSRVGPDAVAVLPALIKTAESETDLIRMFALASIGNIGPGAKPAIPLLKKLLESDDRFAPMHAADALARIGPDALPTLIEALKSKKRETRLEAVHTFHLMGTDAKPAISALEKTIKDDPDFIIQSHAAAAKEMIGTPPQTRRYWVYGKEVKSEDEPTGKAKPAK